GSLPRQILGLSLPSIVELALLSVGGVLHAFWMGRVGDLALAAVTMGTSLRLVLISPMMGLSAGGMAVVARRCGADDTRRADHATMQAVLLIIFFVIPLAILGQLMGPTFLKWMGAKEKVLQDAIAYLRIVFGGLLFMEALPSINGVIRGAGYPEYTLRINFVSVVVMSLVETVLVLGVGPFPALGVRAAGWATVLGSASGVMAQFLVLLGGKAGVRLHWRDLCPDLGVMRQILRIAIPTTAQRFSPNLTNALLIKLMAYLGNDVLAAYSVLSRVRGFLRCAYTGVGNVTATMVGQNLGAEKPERAQRAVTLATVGGVFGTLLLFGGLNLWPTAVLGLFNLAPAAMEIAIVAVGYATLFDGGMAWSFIVGRALAGAGDALSPMVVNMASLWLVQLPLCWLLSVKVGLGHVGVWLGLAVSYLVSGAAMTLRFRQGYWKKIKIG
ncbi:MAG: MATE family efflux transporter, partial [Chloroflexota bacterium]|nr:MATE family efflux transporter [Chloroflexota bacterium]